jgi:ketopantoate reductase
MFAARPRVVLIGVGKVGGVGATTASVLHHVDNCDLTLVAWEDTLVVMTANDLTVQLPYRGGDAAYRCNPRVVSMDDTDTVGPQDFLFIVTKAHHLPPLLDTLLPLCGHDTSMVPCMNGNNYTGGSSDLAGFVAPIDPDGRLWSELGVARAISSVLW